VTVRPILQSILQDINFDDLPPEWSTLDIVSFSENKRLWNFQQEALKNAIKALYLYYKKDNANKEKFYERFRNNGLDEDVEKKLDIKITQTKKELELLYRQYYQVEGDMVRFHNFINRSAFWMATGSGKTLVIVKLIEILKILMERGEIPVKDILVLTYRDDLINQLKKHVNEFNELYSKRGFKINLVELKEYDRIKRESLTTFLNEATVFYYRSDLISDEQKEKVIDFRNYENNGDWYIILDEAHKGDKEESMRQMLYSIMSRNGFLFNFSATFTDLRDVLTTVFNFNLERFITEGYGKHIFLLEQEIRAFKEKEDDYGKEEKQKIVLKSLILLTYLKMVREEIKKIVGELYHEPMMLALVNTVNLTKKDAERPDLILFFEEIERIGKGKMNEKAFEEAKKELLEEFSKEQKPIYEEIPLKIDKSLINEIKAEDILKHVYNSDKYGSIEAIVIPKTEKEAIFKLKTSDKPFALIKIGDAIKWIKDNLKGYEVIESYEDRSIFERLNEREDISILMGSRAFYEGWDSNRPNVILFINIGVGAEAKKFVIQSIGRGVRIEPIKGKRKRLMNLYNEGEDAGIFPKIEKYVQPIETLFIFGTNRNALKEVIETLKLEREPGEIIDIIKKNEYASMQTLLIPVFKTSIRKLYEEKAPQKLPIQEDLFNALKDYFASTDDRVLIVRNDMPLHLLKHIKDSFNQVETYYKILPGNSNVPIKIAVQKLIAHFDLNLEELDRFKPLEEEIVHFKKIRVFLGNNKEIEELKNRIIKVSEYKNAKTRKKELKSKFEKGEISLDKYTEEIEELAKIPEKETFKELRIVNILNHYYTPLILSEKEKVDYIKHVITTKSEVKFIEDLETYLEKSSDKINVDWWMFSKIDEHLDEIYIPYYDPDNNKMRKFKPDFIFWFNKGDQYFIIFVDPKGIKHTEYENKVDWFEKIFGSSDSPKIFTYDNLKIRVFLYLYTEDVNKLSEKYKKYWFDNIESLFGKIGSVI